MYARLDGLEPPPEDWHEGVTGVLDSVDADWFDQVGREQGTLADPSFAGEVERHVSMLEVPFEHDAVGSRAFPRRRGPVIRAPALGQRRRPDGPALPEPVAPPIERSLESMERTRGAIERDLNRTTSLDTFPDADADDISALLAGIPAARRAVTTAALRSSSKDLTNGRGSGCSSRPMPGTRTSPGSGLDFTHLVAAHHGGLTRSHIVPRSDGRACGRLVYTYGRPNRNRHPIGSVVAARAAVWATDLRTENRGPSGLGHVHLYWDDTDPNADPLCWTGRGGATGMCDLTCQQR